MRKVFASRFDCYRFFLCALLFVCLQLFAIGQGVDTSRQGPKRLSVPVSPEGFSFVILGDRTTGNREGLKVLQQAVAEINLLRPDFVINVGDMIQGYNQKTEWIQQAKEFKKILKMLDPPFFPVAGNHDVYWQGEGRPSKEHEEDYEKVFGPLWYAFEHQNCYFIVLFSDEGNLETGEKTFNKPSAQTMSNEQFSWLRNTLKKATDAEHVFLFLHHPRWYEGGYGRDWRRVHQILKEAGNVSVVFAGHSHSMRYFGKKDGIEYFTLGTTGGHIPEKELARQARHHYFVMNVNSESYSISMVPVGQVQDPKKETLLALMLPTGWLVDKESTRRLEFPVQVSDYAAKGVIMKIGVGHAADNSGDKGLWAILLDTEQKEVKKQFFKSTGVGWMECKVQQGQGYTIVLEDLDSDLKGAYPGNGGNIQVYLEIKD